MEELELYFDSLKPWIDLKVKEFHHLGYPQITTEDIWRYLKTFRWKKEIPVHYYQQINDILNLMPNHYLDFASLEAQVYQVRSLDEMNLNDLF
ncbi:post-transcriptional regulator [Pisciglobus halotolerans]|uniref:Post-transcriptional regulator n=1 Tax=Pisciglobus halotolerans TaxID=745365 RepID=A0A1I3CRY8_9LACT|nr:post-transcriptional regulator [Pisciglobus halotolerans]SFH77285.1 Post-transcriptional regulator [Pisciglobus halotolerans]